MSDSDYYGSSLCSSVAEPSSPPSSRSASSQLKQESHPFTRVIDPSVLEGLLSEISVTDSDTLEQLDRENAHFTISESIISVFEEIKWGLQEKLFVEERKKFSKQTAEETIGSPSSLGASSMSSEAQINIRSQLSRTSSTASSMENKQWIRIKCLSLQEESGMSRSASCGLLNEHATDDTNSGNSSNSSTPTTSCMRPSTSLSSMTACPLDQLEASFALSSLKETGFSVSTTSLFSSK
jgi:hypothetical protein